MKYIAADGGRFVAASHEDAVRPGVLKRVIASHADLPPGQVMMVNWARLPRGSSFQPHYHEDMQEVFILISGHVRMMVADQSFEMTNGDTVIVDPREVHQMTNLSDTDADYVVFGIARGEGGQTVVVK